MLRANAASQVSIVNQRYTRLDLLRLTYNDPWIVSKRNGIAEAVKLGKYHQLTFGLSQEETGSPGIKAVATTVNIARSKDIANTLGRGPTYEGTGSEPKERAYVRVRNSLTLCIPMSFDNRGQSFSAVFGVDHPLEENYDPSGTSGSAGSFGDVCGGPPDAPGS